ncbi:hypothetical protein RintRC_6823 [Richelia intracellularis]|nr:hypothetical protein RintRC_6823 [Richelia intracellularis]
MDSPLGLMEKFTKQGLPPLGSNPECAEKASPSPNAPSK